MVHVNRRRYNDALTGLDRFQMGAQGILLTANPGRAAATEAPLASFHGNIMETYFLRRGSCGPGSGEDGCNDP